MKIAVITDSGSGLSKQEANNLGIYYLPLQIIVEDKMYLDGENISIDELYTELRNGAMPSTSMPPAGVMVELLEDLKAQGYDEAIAITLSSGLSSTSQILLASAADVGFKVNHVEIYSTANIEAYIAKCAKNLVDQGLTSDEIIKRLNDAIKDSNTLIIPDDLQHLKRGGRLTPLAAALGGLLKIKPVLQLNTTTEGKIDVCDKVRTMSKAFTKVVDTFAQNNLNEQYVLTILHADALEDATKLNELAVQAMPTVQNVTFGKIGAVLAAHTGLGCLGIQYIRKVEGANI